MDLHTIELFAGVGMLGEGLRAGLGYLGIQTRTVCYVEREAYTAAVLAARIQEGSLDAAPIWSDVTIFSARRWAGVVDCVVAGFPCQDLSVAGLRAGLDGARSGLFFEVLRIARDCGAEWLFLENVAGIATATAAAVDEAEGALEERAAARVVGELADFGWDAEWVTIPASDVGASHGRDRWFCLAKMADPQGRRRGVGQRAERARGAEVEGAGHALGHAGLQHQLVQQRRARTEHPGTGGAMENRHDVGAHRGGRWAEKVRRGEPAQSDCSLANAGQPVFAPGPADPAWAEIIRRRPHLAPALESGFCGVANGVAHRMDDSRAQRLKCCGNGVVAAQAAAAFVALYRRLTWHSTGL